MTDMIDHEDLIDDIQLKFKECYEIFKAKAFDENETPIACKIHDAFGGMTGEHHNCLGCNFADSTRLISNYLEKSEEMTDIQQDFTIYILLQYLIVERMDTVLEILQIPEKYKEKHFKVFQQIRKWANFIKHPKSFILTHHPEFDFENSGYEYDREFSVTINEQFVETYYKGQKNPDDQKKTNKELYSKLKNKKDIVVIFPDIAKLTDKLCYSISKFTEIITKNEVYIEILNDETTISNYFENE
jgi:hypothetical protein